jgi:nitrogen fixation protein FixH
LRKYDIWSPFYFQISDTNDNNATKSTETTNSIEPVYASGGLTVTAVPHDNRLYDANRMPGTGADIKAFTSRVGNAASPVLSAPR